MPISFPSPFCCSFNDSRTALQHRKIENQANRHHGGVGSGGGGGGGGVGATGGSPTGGSPPGGSSALSPSSKEEKEASQGLLTRGQSPSRNSVGSVSSKAGICVILAATWWYKTHFLSLSAGCVTKYNGTSYFSYFTQHGLFNTFSCNIHVKIPHLIEIQQT